MTIPDKYAFWRWPSKIQQLSKQLEELKTEHERVLAGQSKLLEWVKVTHRLGSPAEGIRAMFQSGKRIVPLLAMLLFGQCLMAQPAPPILRSPLTTNSHFGPTPTEGQVPIWNAAAKKWSNNIPSGGSVVFGDLVWTNDNGVLKPIAFPTNILLRVNAPDNGVATNFYFDSRVFRTNATSKLFQIYNGGSNALTIGPNGGLFAGRGNSTPFPGAVLYGIFDTALGETNQQEAFIFSRNSAVGYSGGADMIVDTNYGALILVANKEGGTKFSRFAVQAGAGLDPENFNTFSMQALVDGADYMHMDPNFTLLTPTNYLFSSSVRITNIHTLMSLQNSNFPVLEVDGVGDLRLIKKVPYLWPSSQGAAGTALTNNGSGVLGWWPITVGGTVNFSDLLWTNEPSGRIHPVTFTNRLEVQRSITIGTNTATYFLAPNSNDFLFAGRDITKGERWGPQFAIAAFSNSVTSVAYYTINYRAAGHTLVSTDENSNASIAYIYARSESGPGGDPEILLSTTNGYVPFASRRATNTILNNVTYQFPTSQGAAGTVLTNNGSGTLGWGIDQTSVGGGSLTTNANQFLGVPLAIKDGAFLTNVNIESSLQVSNGHTYLAGPVTNLVQLNLPHLTVSRSAIINAQGDLTNSSADANWSLYPTNVWNDRQGGSVLLSNLVANPYTGYTNQVFGGTNISVRTVGGTNFIDTTGFLNNWSLYSTNVWNSRQGGSATLTNLSGTGAITNLFSATLSNATIKPLVVGVGDAAGATNTTGAIRGLEAGANITLTPNGSNYVIASTASGGVAFSDLVWTNRVGELLPNAYPTNTILSPTNNGFRTNFFFGTDTIRTGGTNKIFRVYNGTNNAFTVSDSGIFIGSGNGTPINGQAVNAIYDTTLGDAPAKAISLTAQNSAVGFNSSAVTSVSTNFAQTVITADRDGTGFINLSQVIGGDATWLNFDMYVLAQDAGGTIIKPMQFDPDFSLSPTSYIFNSTMRITNIQTLLSLQNSNTPMFEVNGIGDLKLLKRVAYSWPSAQGSSSTALTNDGSGNLGWWPIAVGGGTVTFADLVWTNNLGRLHPNVYQTNIIFAPTNTGPGGQSTTTNFLFQTSTRRIGGTNVLFAVFNGGASALVVGDQGIMIGSTNYIPVPQAAIDIAYDMAFGVDTPEKSILLTTYHSTVGYSGNAEMHVSTNYGDFNVTANKEGNGFVQYFARAGGVGTGVNYLNFDSYVLIQDEGATVITPLQFDPDFSMSPTSYIFGTTMRVTNIHTLMSLQNSNTPMFEVDGIGDLKLLKRISYSWPNAQGAVRTVLTNDGSGNLGWGSAAGQVLRTIEEFNGKTVFTNLDFTGSIIKVMTNAITGSRTNNLTNAISGASMIVYVVGDTATATDFNYTFTAASANIRWMNATTNSNGIDVLIHSNQVYTFRFDVVTNATGPATNIIAQWATDSPRPILNDPIPISSGAGTSNAWVGGVVFLDATTATTNLQATAVYTNLFTFTVPANTLTNLGDELEFYLSGHFKYATANTNGFKCIYGTSTLFDTGFLTISNCPWRAKITITRTGNSTERVEAEVIAQSPAAGSFGNGTLTAYRTNMPLAQVNGVTNIFAFQGTSRVVAAITNDYRRIKWNSGPKGSVP